MLMVISLYVNSERYDEEVQKHMGGGGGEEVQHQRYRGGGGQGRTVRKKEDK